MKNTSLYSLVHSGGGPDDPVLTDADKAAMIEGQKRNYDAVLALKKAGQPYTPDNHSKFNWMFAFPLLTSHIAEAGSGEEAASTAASGGSASGGAGKKRAGAAQDKPSAKKPATKPEPARKKKT